MRKIIESTLVSLDGVIGTPHLWAGDYFDKEAQQQALEQLLASDAMLMGRRTYEIFAALWPGQAGDYAASTSSPRPWKKLTGTTRKSSGATSRLR